MNWTIIPTGILFAMAAAVVALTLYRKTLAVQEEDLLHIRDTPGHPAGQTGLATKLDSVERWGKSLMIALLVYGVALLLYWSYQISFVDTSRGMG